MPFSSTADLGKTLFSIATLYFTFEKGRLQLIHVVSSTGNLHNHGVQRRMISVDIFFVFLRLLFFALLLLFVT